MLVAMRFEYVITVSGALSTSRVSYLVEGLLPAFSMARICAYDAKRPKTIASPNLETEITHRAYVRNQEELDRQEDLDFGE